MKTLAKKPWKAILVLALGSLGAPAQVRGPNGVDRPVLPALVFLPPSLGEANPPAWAKEFETTLIQDLTHSQAFRLLPPKKLGNGTEGSGFKHWREAGADLLLRTLPRPAKGGRLMLESECIALGPQSILMNKLFVGEFKAVHRMAHRLADLLVGKVTGIPGCADSKLLFAHQTAPGIKEIFGQDRDGRNLRQFTNFRSLSTFPAVSVDGKLAFVTYKGGPPEIWGQTQVMGPIQRVYPREHGSGFGLSDLAWAPDGKRLAFVQNDRKGNAEILLLDAQGQKTYRLTMGGHLNRVPSWSPDGTRIAFLSDRAGSPQVFVMDSDGAHVRQVTADPSIKTCVAWSPVEDRIACIQRSNGWSELSTLTSDGSGRKNVPLGADPIEGISWAPDGRCLAMAFGLGPATRIRIVGLDGTTQDFPGSPDSRQCPQWVRNHPSPSPFSQADPPAAHLGPARRPAQTHPKETLP